MYDGKDRIALLELFKKNKADLRVVDSDKRNALHLACINGNTDIVKWFIKNCKKIDLNAKGGLLEMMPFLFALWYGHIDIMNVLRDEGVELNTKSIFSHNALHLACTMDKPEIFDWIFKNIKDIELEATIERSNITPFLCAVQAASLETIKRLVEEGANYKVVDKNGNNALSLAKKSKRREDVISYLEKKLELHSFSR